MPDQSLSGLQVFDPSGSTPQPAPLSGLPLPTLFGGMGGEQGMSGTGGPAGGPVGSAGGPGLDFFQLLAQIQGQGAPGITATPPNLSSLLGGIGTGGIGPSSLGQQIDSGAFPGFGQAGGTTEPAMASPATGFAGSTGGQLDSIELIKQALGIGKQISSSLNQGQAGATAAPGGNLSLGDFPGTSLTGGAGTASPTLFQPGDLTSSFLDDPTIGGLIMGGGLLGGTVSADLWDQFKNDPAFLRALTTGQTTDTSNLLSDNPLGGVGGLEMPDLSGGRGGGIDAGNIGAGFGGLQNILGLVQNAQGGNPMGILQNLYGLYNAASGISPTLPSLTGALSAIAPSLGSSLASVLPLLSSIPSLMQSDNPGGAAALAAGKALMGAGGGAMSVAAAVPDIWDSVNSYFKTLAHANAQRRETEGIKRDFDTAWPAYQDTPNTLNAIQNATDPAEIQRLLQSANYQLAQAPAVSHYISTRGGAQNGPFFSPSADLSQINPVSPLYSMDAVLGNTLALDKLQQLGITPDMGPGGLNISDVWSNPQAALGGLWGSSGLSKYDWLYGGQPTYTPNEAGTYTANPSEWKLTPQQAAGFAQPGQRLQGIQSLFAGLNPNFAETPLGIQLARLLGA